MTLYFIFGFLQVPKSTRVYLKMSPSNTLSCFLMAVHNVHCYPGVPSLTKKAFQNNKVGEIRKAFIVSLMYYVLPPLLSLFFFIPLFSSSFLLLFPPSFPPPHSHAHFQDLYSKGTIRFFLKEIFFSCDEDVLACPLSQVQREYPSVQVGSYPDSNPR